VLRHLVRAAAVDNANGLKKAKRKLIESGFAADGLNEFNSLPPDVAAGENIAETARRLKDATQAERIVTDWQRFFRDKYDRIAQ